MTYSFGSTLSVNAYQKAIAENNLLSCFIICGPLGQTGQEAYIYHPACGTQQIPDSSAALISNTGLSCFLLYISLMPSVEPRTGASSNRDAWVRAVFYTSGGRESVWLWSQMKIFFFLHPNVTAYQTPGRFVRKCVQKTVLAK